MNVLATLIEGPDDGVIFYGNSELSLTASISCKFGANGVNTCDGYAAQPSETDTITGIVETDLPFLVQGNIGSMTAPPPSSTGAPSNSGSSSKSSNPSGSGTSGSGSSNNNGAARVDAGFVAALMGGFVAVALL